jgi:hypothetical protein
MGLLKRAHVRGLNFGLIRNGLIAYPSAKFANEVADAVADNVEDTEAPEMTDGAGMTAAEVAPILQKLVEVAQEIAAKTGSARDLGLNKVSADANLDIVKLAYAHADRCIQKAALESGTNNPGSGPAEHSQVTSEGETDAQKNPSSAVVGPQGSTSLDVSAGMVGSQSVRPNQPGTQDSPAPTTLADVKISALLAKLSADGTLPQGGGRQDLNTNAHMKRVVVPQGTTHSTTPHVPVPLKKHPAAPQPAIGNDLQADVKKTAAQLLSTPEGRQIINTLAEQQKQAAQNEELDIATGIILTALQQQHAAQ